MCRVSVVPVPVERPDDYTGAVDGPAVVRADSHSGADGADAWPDAPAVGRPVRFGSRARRRLRVPFLQ